MIVSLGPAGGDSDYEDLPYGSDFDNLDSSNPAFYERVEDFLEVNWINVTDEQIEEFARTRGEDYAEKLRKRRGRLHFVWEMSRERYQDYLEKKREQEELVAEWEALDSCQKFEILMARQQVREETFPGDRINYADRYYPLGEGEILSDFPVEFVESTPPVTRPVDVNSKVYLDLMEAISSSSPATDDPVGSTEVARTLPSSSNDFDPDRDRRQRQALAEGLPPEELPGDMDPDEYYDFKASYDGMPWTEIDSSGKPIRHLPGGLTGGDIEGF